MSISVGQLVEHSSDVAFGHGKVSSVDTIAGVVRVGVRWSNKEGLHEHTANELSILCPMSERLKDVGPASRVPFQLRAFGRWFEARHALTGELSNQPFQMLPHQVIVTNRVVNSAPANRAWLIADDVGLGKTIEAGMILEVLRKKTLGRFRCLILTPAGLMQQWKEEMARRFGREFRIFDSRVPNDLETVDQIVASVDTLRMEKFKQALQTATPWDLVIFDEAHHLATTPNVLAYQLAQTLKTQGKAQNLLFLTATPHSGNNERFFNMLRILREDLFPKGQKDYPHVSLKQVMIRNRKSDVTDIAGKRIFKGIAPAKIIAFAPSKPEVSFYEELQQYLRNGYKAADKLQRQKGGQRASAVGFLMSTFGKLASSSRAAIESALQNRMRALQGDAEAMERPKAEPAPDGDARFPGEQATSRVNTDGIEIVTHKGKKRKESLIDGELAQVESLLGRLSSLRGDDSKLTSFITYATDHLPTDVKVLIFTEYRATQDVLAEALRRRFGENSVATINGSMKMQDRGKQVDDFNENLPHPRFMVSTEAGGEGLNMQKSCHMIVNYDLPWNPMNLQQRIGRVYRYGQTQPVVVVNIKVDSDSDAFADQRVYEYLERKITDVTAKLAEVQDGNAEDILGEVLGQVAEKLSLKDLYKTAVEAGRKKAEGQIDIQTDMIKTILADPQGMLGHFKGLERFDITDYRKVAARVSAEHLHFFVTQYLGHQGATVTQSSDGLLSFTVPKRLTEVAGYLRKADPYEVKGKLDDTTIERSTVSKEVAQKTLGCRLLRFGDPAFEAMVGHVQHGAFGGNGVASLELPAGGLGWPTETQGTWVLFDLRIVRQEGSVGGARVLKSELASFVIPAGGTPTLRDDVVECLHEAIDGPTTIDPVEATRAYQAARKAADERLRVLYAEIVKEFGTDTGILPQDVQDVGLAWVRAR